MSTGSAVSERTMPKVELDFSRSRAVLKCTWPNEVDNGVLVEEAGYDAYPVSGVNELRMAGLVIDEDKGSFTISASNKQALERFYKTQGIQEISLGEGLWKGLAGQLKAKRDNMVTGDLDTYRDPTSSLRESWLDRVGARPHAEVCEDSVCVRSEETYREVLQNAMERLNSDCLFSYDNLENAERAASILFYQWLKAYGLKNKARAGQEAMVSEALSLIGKYSRLSDEERRRQDRWIAHKTGQRDIGIQAFVDVLDKIKEKRLEIVTGTYRTPEVGPVIEEPLGPAASEPISNMIRLLIPEPAAPEPAPPAVEPPAPEADMPKSFAERVYDVVRRIPKGQVATYKQIAEALGMNRGYQAIGQALKRNTDPAVACHRVIKSSGELGGLYGTETNVKKMVLRIEGVEIDNNTVDLGKYKCEL